jgi:hypothetical protein
MELNARLLKYNNSKILQEFSQNNNNTQIKVQLADQPFHNASWQLAIQDKYNDNNHSTNHYYHLNK